MTTATLPIPALTPAPGPAAQGGPAAAGKGPSFSQVLARQQGGKPGEAGTPAAPGGQAGAPAQGPATQNPAGAGKPGNPGDTAALPVDGQQEPAAETAADAATLAALAAQAAPAPALPLQALEIAAEAADTAPAMPPALPQAAQPAVAGQVAVAASAPNAPAAETAATPPAAPSLPHPLPSTGGTPEDGGEAAEPPATAPAQPQPLAAAEHGAALHAAAQAHIAARQAVGNPAPASLPAAAQPLGLEVASPVGSSQWGQELGRQLVTISHDARQGHHTAELRLDPPDLGPLRVSINLHEGVASAAFVSVHAAVR